MYFALSLSSNYETPYVVFHRSPQSVLQIWVTTSCCPNWSPWLPCQHVFLKLRLLSVCTSLLACWALPTGERCFLLRSSFFLRNVCASITYLLLDVKGAVMTSTCTSFRRGWKKVSLMSANRLLLQRYYSFDSYLRTCELFFCFVYFFVWFSIWKIMCVF